MKNLIRSILPLIFVCQLSYVASAPLFNLKTPQNTIRNFVDIINGLARQRQQQTTDSRSSSKYGSEHQIIPLVVGDRHQGPVAVLDSDLYATKPKEPAILTSGADDMFELPSDKRDYGAGGGRWGKRGGGNSYFYGGGRFGRSVDTFDHVDPDMDDAFE